MRSGCVDASRSNHATPAAPDSVGSARPRDAFLRVATQVTDATVNRPSPVEARSPRWGHWQPDNFSSAPVQIVVQPLRVLHELAAQGVSVAVADGRAAVAHEPVGAGLSREG